MKHISLGLLLLICSFFTGCDSGTIQDPGADENGHTAPTTATIAANSAVWDELDFSDQQDFEDASRGLIASDPDLKVASADGGMVWNQPSWAGRAA